MKHMIAIIGAALLAACGSGQQNAPAAADATTKPPSALPEGPGWTAATHPQDIITARRELMLRMQQLIAPIDGLQAGARADPHMLKEHAELIAVMLTATPHLYPPSTNLHDQAAKEPATLALPAIWQSFDAFYAMAGASANAAREFATAEGKDMQLKAGASLRATCDACHAQYLRPYKPAAAEASDQEFDFDSALN